MSDSESDCEEILPAETPNAKRVKVDSSPYDAHDDSTDDIFAVDFNCEFQTGECFYSFFCEWGNIYLTDMCICNVYEIYA